MRSALLCWPVSRLLAMPTAVLRWHAAEVLRRGPAAAGGAERFLLPERSSMGSVLCYAAAGCLSLLPASPSSSI